MCNTLIFIVIERFDLIYKSKFCDLSNFIMYRFFNICHMSNMYKTYHLSILNFVDLKNHIIYKKEYNMYDVTRGSWFEASHILKI